MARKTTALTLFYILLGMSPIMAQPSEVLPLDLNGDEQVTRSEMVDHLRSKFRLLDNNSDGVLVLDELPRVMPLDDQQRARMERRRRAIVMRAEKQGLPLSDDALTRDLAPSRLQFVARHDANGDERVDFDEFSKRAFMHFSLADTNKDDVVTAAECEQMKREIRRGGRRKSRG